MHANCALSFNKLKLLNTNLISNRHYTLFIQCAHLNDGNVHRFKLVEVLLKMDYKWFCYSQLDQNVQVNYFIGSNKKWTFFSGIKSSIFFTSVLLATRMRGLLANKAFMLLNNVT